MQENNNNIPFTPVSKELRDEKTREKNLAIIKANNELLEYSKKSIIETDKLDNETKTVRLEELNSLISENIAKAKNIFKASEEELNNIQYNQVSEEEVEKYKERLKKKGVTEEENENMTLTIVSTNNGKTKSKRKHIPKKKQQEIIDSLEDEKIERVKGEEQLMRNSIATDESIKRRIEDNKRKELEERTLSIDSQLEQQIEKKKIKNNNSDKSIELTQTNEDEYIDNGAIEYDFDFKSIPSYVQYDMLPLPSKGQCYPVDSPLRSGRIPVAYLTASDENIIASPNMYRDGKVIDVILERKILDKRINSNDLIEGDRDAIIVWLRATGYGPNFPIITTNPNNGKQYDVNINLSDLNYLDFNLKSDKDGLFTYKTENGDVIKYNYMTHKENEIFRQNIINNNINADKLSINKSLNDILETLENIEGYDENDINDIKGCVEDAKDILNSEVDNVDTDIVYANGVTEQMILTTKSINGIKDEEYIKGYIENMRSNESYKYRMHVTSTRPGVNFEINIDIPESDGGGSFTTFLQLSNTVFLNI